MKASHYWLQTQRSVSQDVICSSQQLMIKAGMIRSLGSGLIAWLPTGLKALHKLSAFIRREMEAIGALEILMPILQPSALWETTGRIEKYGPELFSLKDRHDKRLILGPTHEECIAILMQHRFSTKEDLPKTFFQIQTKFRDERRPRSGIIRAREFLMKDAYSFHGDDSSLNLTYDAFYQAYLRIFNKLQLKIAVVAADNGQIGGSLSHEFHAICASGEDAIALTTSNRAVIASAVSYRQPVLKTSHSITSKDCTLYLFSDQKKEGSCIPVVTLRHHTVNKLKLKQILKDLNLDALKLVPKNQYQEFFNENYTLDHIKEDTCPFTCYIDDDAAEAFFHDFKRKHPIVFGNFRSVILGDPIDEKGEIVSEICPTLEIGHIFQLGTTYSTPFGLTNPENNSQFLQMGCYGIGVSRLIAAIIEQHSDEKGVRFPLIIAPFTVGIFVLNAMHFSQMTECAKNLYNQCLVDGVDVFFDDRAVRPGVMLTDAERIGIPILIIFGHRSFQKGQVECRVRLPEKDLTFEVSLEEIAEWVKSQLSVGG